MIVRRGRGRGDAPPSAIRSMLSVEPTKTGVAIISIIFSLSTLAKGVIAPTRSPSNAVHAREPTSLAPQSQYALACGESSPCETQFNGGSAIHRASTARMDWRSQRERPAPCQYNACGVPAGSATRRAPAGCAPGTLTRDRRGRSIRTVGDKLQAVRCTPCRWALPAVLGDRGAAGGCSSQPREQTVTPRRPL
jgi:hypothetical protein